MATEGMPISVPSNAAETVPEYVTSSPRFRPRLMPEKSSFGRSSFSRCRTPQLTPSVACVAVRPRAQRVVHREGVPRRAALLVRSDREHLADLAQRCGETLDTFRKD